MTAAATHRIGVLDAAIAPRVAALAARDLLRDDATPPPDAVVACSNLYLGDDGIGAGASRLVSGTRAAHLDLERALAAWVGAPAALLFNSGYAANAGAIPALADRGDAVFSDALNHASIIDGVRLSRAERVIYPHADLAALDRALAACEAPGLKLVATESVFSMDGDVVPLADLVELCRRHSAALYVDEAHALGVCGRGGRGVAHALGLAADVDVLVGTLGKSFGAFGAFAATSNAVRRYLVSRARTFVFSTALPESVAEGALAALPLLIDGAAQARLWERIDRLCAGLERAGWWQGRAASAIIPLLAGTERDALAWSREVAARGYFVQAIRPPTVPPGTSRLRLTVSASYDDALVDGLVDALVESARALGIPPTAARHVQA
ncbi:MAG: aminotransferase class I/II-fold pyridoxal phosphate-dependent enzyme [Myxococcales bacterium]|nr:aminotransferase class I/II-fold pyridoxal phosphate-dependent enzyme [Myxococcales bacterium]